MNRRLEELYSPCQFFCSQKHIQTWTWFLKRGFPLPSWGDAFVSVSLILRGARLTVWRLAAFFFKRLASFFQNCSWVLRDFPRLTGFSNSSIFPLATGVGRFARLSGRWAVALASNPTGVAFFFLGIFALCFPISPLLPFSPDCRTDMEIAPSKAFQQPNTGNKLRRRDVCSGRPLEARRCYCP